MKEFLAKLSLQGFNLQEVILDGKIHRFARNSSFDSAWYIGWQNHSVKDGSPYIVAEYGDWKTQERYLHKPDNSILSIVDKQAIKAQLEESKQKSEIDKKIRHSEAAVKARKYWETAYEIGSTPYMEKKKINKLYGAKVYKDVLQVPLRDISGLIWGIQYITDKYKKFLTGSKIEGCFHVIGKIETDILLCEGFATGCSLHQATEKSVVVAFNAGNMVIVAKILKLKYPDLNVTVCGDDDRFTVVNGEHINAGRIKGDKAALMSHGVSIYPIFENDEPTIPGGKGPTDFNDLHCREGLEQVRKQIINNESEIKVGFIPLGYDESTFFFYHIPSKDIVKVSTFSKAQMYQIAPAEYWEERYPKKQGDIDMSASVNHVIQISKQVGPFDSTRIRGTGVWMDDNRIVINIGKSLVVDGKQMSLSSIRSQYIYIQTKNNLPPMTNPLSVEECQPLIDACLALKWKDQKSGYLLAGWLFTARIAGSLPIRPHVWLTGGSGTGKSTVMDQLIAPALGCDKGKIYLQGSSTEAGIRQRMKCSSVPTIFDEFETTGEGSKERVAGLVELLRNTWGATRGSVVKGSAGGSSVEYSLQFSALLSSIRVNLENDADRSRFSILELSPHGNDLDRWLIVRQQLKKIDEMFGERLFARAAIMVRTVIKNHKRISDALSCRVNQRYGQQVGMLLAGWWALSNNDVISIEQAESLADELDVVEEKEEAEITDEIECLMHLMSWKISIRVCSLNNSHDWREMSIGEALNSNERNQVKAYGIKVLGDQILIADKNAELSKIYRHTRWVSWHLSLRRIDGVTKSVPTRFGGPTCRATCIPLSIIKANVEPSSDDLGPGV